MRTRAFAVAVAAACAVTWMTGCGTAHSGSGGQPPRLRTASPAPSRSGSSSGHSASHRRTLTVADNGAKVRLRPGQKIVVILASQAQTWHVPRASGAAVRRTSSRGGYPVSQVAFATFLAVRPGTATLTALTDARCLHAAPPCAIPQRVWAVTVIVSQR